MAPHGSSSLASWLAAAALGLAAACAIAAPAFAQGAQPSGPVSLGDLFTPPNGMDLKPGTLDELKRRVDSAPTRQCRLQKAKFKVIVVRGDDLFQQALGAARRDVIDAALKRLGIDPNRFSVDYDHRGERSEVQFDYGPIEDKELPTLDSNSNPPKGTKVNVNRRIVVTMTARDLGDARTRRWQTGVRHIKLQDQDGSLVEDTRCGAMPDQCNPEVMQRTCVKTYTVPPNPPPIVRLEAFAVDFAGNVTDPPKVAEFPTGDFYGTFKTESANRYRTTADIVLNHDGRGNLTGTMVGEQRVDFSWSDCSQRTIRPNRFRASLVGTYTEGRSLKVFIKEIEESKLLEERRCEGGSIPPVRFEFGFRTHIWPPEPFLGTPSPMGEGEVLADGTRQYKLDHRGTTAAVTLHRARD